MRKETPVVDLAEGMVYPLPPHLQATLNPIQKRMRSTFGIIFMLLIVFCMGALPIIGIPPVVFFLECVGLISHYSLQRFLDLCSSNGMSIMMFLYENLYGIRIRTFGYGGTFKKRSLLIMNHVSHLDWMYMWDLIDRQGQLSCWKAITKVAPVKYIPILGHCMQYGCYLFVRRKWEEDRKEFERKLYYFNSIDYPLQLLLFPEGGDFTPRTRSISDKFAEDNNLPYYNYCFHPRTTGFNYAMNALRDGGLDAVYDITIAYPDVLPKTEVDVWKGILPREVHFHVRSFENKDIPEEQEGLKKWLLERWEEKEERLKTFYTHHQFREKADDKKDKECFHNKHVGNSIIEVQKSPEVLRQKNFPHFLYSIFLFSSSNFIIYVLYVHIPFFWLYMVLGAIFLTVGTITGNIENLMMSFKQQETKAAIKSSKYN